MILDPDIVIDFISHRYNIEVSLSHYLDLSDPFGGIEVSLYTTDKIRIDKFKIPFSDLENPKHNGAITTIEIINTYISSNLQELLI